MTRAWMMALFVCLLAGAASGGSNPEDMAPNLLRGADFEGEAGRRWHGGNGQVVETERPAAGTTHVLRVSQERPVWKMAAQNAPVPEGAVRVRIGGRAKTAGVAPPPGAEWRRAQMQVGFHDRYRKLIGEWRSVDLPLGDTEWARYEGTFEVPPESESIKVFLGLNHVSGTVWLDDVRLETFDQEGNALDAPRVSRTDTSDWFPLDSSPEDYGRPAVVDLSGRLDRPAGRHGFVEVRDGHFAFRDGGRARFWGTNITAGDCFPDHETAERTAARLAKFGCNMLRFHHMDAGWASPNMFSIEGGYLDNTQQLSPESLERLDYFIAQLKERGIYVYMDLLVHRPPGEEDLQGLPDPGQGMKVVSHFNRRLIELQKQYARQLLTHRNRYTGNRYVDEPAVAMMELINESSLFWFGHLRSIPDAYMQELGGMFDRWCEQEGRRRPEGSLPELIGERQPDLMRFLYETQVAYFEEMEGFLREIGVKVPIAGSNHWESAVGDLLSNAQLDYIDRHTYWDHPQGGFSPTDSFDNQPMVRQPVGSNPENLARRRIEAMPYIVTEWNNCWANEYITEGPLLMAAYGAFQDWDGMLQFAYAGGDWAPAMGGAFNIANKPHIMAPYATASLVFRRADVPPAGQSYVASLSGQDEELARDVRAMIPGGLPLVRRVSAALGAPEREPPPSPAEEGSAFAGPQGRLRWDGGRGVFVIDTERAQGALGFLRGREVETADATVTAETEFCQVLLTSLDDRPIADSRSVLLTATARAENTGQKWDAMRTTLLETGEGPVLMEPVRARVTVESEAAPTVHVLDHHGRRTGRTIPVERLEEGWRFRIGDEKAFWYQISRSG